LMKSVGIHQQGFGLYVCRHVFRTIADEVLDEPAINWIMGHADPTMADEYRESVSEDPLQAVTDHVRHWVFGPAKSRKRKPK
jgi:hypothetical protein